MSCLGLCGMVSTRQCQNAAARRWACQRRRGAARRWPRPSSGARNAAGPGPRAAPGRAARRPGPRPPRRPGQLARRPAAAVPRPGRPGSGRTPRRTARRLPARTWPPTRSGRIFDGLPDPGDASLTPGVGRPLGGLADLEDQGGVIDRDPVDRRPDHQLDGQRGGRQPVQQPGQHHVIDRQRHGLGQAGVQVPAGCRASQAAGSAMPRSRSRSSIRTATSSKRACPPRSSASRYSKVRG